MNIVKIASIAGTVLGIAGTLVSSWAGQKATDEAIAKKVAEALANQGNQ
jgi:biopolymer transport protein ExbB/TolQ